MTRLRQNPVTMVSGDEEDAGVSLLAGQPDRQPDVDMGSDETVATGAFLALGVVLRC